MTVHAEKIAHTIRNLRTGERAWFWFGLDMPQNPIVIANIHSTENMNALQKEVAYLGHNRFMRSCFGMLIVDEQGAFQFCGKNTEEAMLDVLSSWVQSNISNQPDLALFKNSSFVHINEEGAVQNRFSNDALWESIPSQPSLGSIASAQHILSTLDTHAEAWIWISGKSSTEQPAVVVIPMNEDQQGILFSPLVRARRSTVENDAGIRGTVTRLQNNALLISTTNALDGINEKIERFFASFGDVRFIQIEKGEAVAAKRIHSVETISYKNTLAAIQNGTPYYFWFSTASGSPILLLEESKNALRSVSANYKSDAPSIRGKLCRAKWGLEFRAQSSYPSFLQEVAQWVAQHQNTNPELLAFVGARMTVRDKEGNVLEKHKDAAAWTQFA